MFPGLPGPGQMPHPSLLGASIPQMPPGFNPSTLTLAERLAGKLGNFYSGQLLNKCVNFESDVLIQIINMVMVN